MAVTEQQVDDALAGLDRAGDLYILPLPGDAQNWAEEAVARSAVRTCLILDIPITGVVVGDVWPAVANRFEAVEARLDALEA